MKTLKPVRLLALLGMATVATSSLAQAWPERPITMIVPFPPGIVDANARLIAAKAATLLGQTIVVKNQPGAGQRIGTEALAKAPKDGYTIGVVTNAGVVSAPALGARINYDAVADFTYIAMGLESHYLINTHPGTGIRTLAEEMKPFGRVMVVAPDKPQSAMGHAITIHSFLRLQRVELMDGVEAWSCSVKAAT